MTRDEEHNLGYDDDEIVREAKSLGYSLPVVPDQVLNIGEADGRNWREFEDVETNSLWIIGARSREGMHDGKYHGNFVPEIPFQAIRRFTKPGDIVLDPFLGSGTTLIECRRQGRHGIGIELIESTAQHAFRRIQDESNPYDTWQKVITGDSTSKQTITEVRQKLQERGHNQVQLLLMHPPYHDIIRFSDHPRDLCNAPTVKDFLTSFKKVVRGTFDLLEREHFLVVVIGDKYSRREWIPLGFYTMEMVKSVGYTLKSIVVKNMEGNRAKRNLQNLWRQRAFKGKYYIFKHEYVFFFEKAPFVENLNTVIDHIRDMDKREARGLIKDKSFVSGEELNDVFETCTWITPPRVLALRHGRRIRAVALDLTDIEITRDVERELENLIARLPQRERIVDVSVLVEPEKRTVQVPGVSQVYAHAEESLEQLAHAMYVIRKAV
jgi:DNA modification methylase